jgi:DNA adenine methylase
VVRDRVDELIEILKDLAMDTSEQTYYSIRAMNPGTQVEQAARLIYLNRLCFNGLYRLNKNGQFNVPYGHLKRPSVCNESLLRDCSSSLKNVSIKLSDFEQCTRSSKAGDVVYFDPPYLPLTKTSNFSDYHSTKFNIEAHKRLARLIDELTDRGVFVILSNSDTEASREIFCSLRQFTVSANRSISARVSGRLPVDELIAVNFDLGRRHEGSRLKKTR